MRKGDYAESNPTLSARSANRHSLSFPKHPVFYDRFVNLRLEQLKEALLTHKLARLRPFDHCLHSERSSERQRLVACSGRKDASAWNDLSEGNSQKELLVSRSNCRESNDGSLHLW